MVVRLRKEEKFQILSEHLSEDMVNLIQKFTERLCKSHQQKLLRLLVVSIDLLKLPLNNNDAYALRQSYLFLRIVLCKKLSYYSCKPQLAILNKFIKFIFEEGQFEIKNTDKLTLETYIPLTESLYISCREEATPDEIVKKFNFKYRLITRQKEGLFSEEIHKRLGKLKVCFNSEVFSLLQNHLSKSTFANQLALTFMLIKYSRLISNHINNNNTDKLIEDIKYIITDLCKQHTKSTAESKYIYLRNFIIYMMEFGYFKDGGNNELYNVFAEFGQGNYELYKNLTIPNDVKNKFILTRTAEEIFNETLNKCCSPEIAQRLKEHVNSFEIKKHHRSPLADFLNQIYEVNTLWYTHPRVIQSEMITFRNKLLDRLSRNTAYGKFQNVKNALSVLSSQGLIPADIELPSNLRRCTSTEKIRQDNPLICNFNIYKQKNKNKYIDTPTFINDLRYDISNNLQELKKHARNVVHDGYKKYKEREFVIAKSQISEFINHPNLLVIKGQVKSKKISYCNPFSTYHQLRIENLTAYYDYFFDDMVSGNKPHDVKHLKLTNDIIGYLGLTERVASAMHLIITEELGINPYSLYRVKISSNNQGHEYVQVDDEGSVRLKAVKPRARNARARKAKGDLRNLGDISASEIDASTCLKMALEMTSRARTSLGVRNLWTCLGVRGVTTSQISGFQKEFKKMVSTASSGNPFIKSATLKKVRTSKGILIFLESNGDSIKTANYFGNTVKTTLNRYIPHYLKELIFRVKIRSFQRIILFMSVANDDNPAQSLNLSQDDFDSLVRKAFKNPDMGGELFGKLTKKEEKEESIYFCLNENNLRLAMSYVKNGNDPKLIDNCKSVLRKVSEGPIIMKQMLRKAQLAEDN